MLFSFKLGQLFFSFIKTLIIYSKLGLEFSLKVIIRIWGFRGEINHFVLNVLWWEYMLFLLWHFGILWEEQCFLFWIKMIDFWTLVFSQLLQFFSSCLNIWSDFSYNSPILLANQVYMILCCFSLHCCSSSSSCL